jgi:alkanesulfonate monooxygenase SsuD/methylene tetrahydromethanopterin reductase-like flavin-dependent oxidoreductase (luciferase family)
MLDEALRVIKALWTEDSPSFDGSYFRLDQAICNPKPVQKPHPPIIVAGQGEKSLRIVATHADEWNATGSGPADWSRLNNRLNDHCDAIDRDPATIRRGAQLLLNPAQENEMRNLLDTLPAFEAAGCQHAVLNFYQPPTEDQLSRVVG